MDEQDPQLTRFDTVVAWVFFPLLGTMVIIALAVLALAGMR